MVIYSCEKCGKTFKQKGHYTNHINKKNPCDNIKDKIESIVENKVDELVKEKLQELVEKGEIEIKNKNLISNKQNSSKENTKMENNENKFTFIEVCSGGGGLSCGLEESGLKPILLNDIDKNSCKTLRLNHPNVDIHEGSFTDIDYSKYINKCDVLCGGVPCQSFSYAGKKKGLDDKRGDLIIKFSEMINIIKPKIFMIENVKGLLTHNKGETIKYVINECLNKNNLYNIDYKLIKCVNYGVPQKRERVIIVGIKKEFDFNFSFPKETNQLVTIKEALKDVPISEGAKYPDKKLKYFKKIPPGGCWINLDVEEQKEYLGKGYYSGGGKRGLLRKLSWDEPCLTILCSPAQKNTERCHPEENRPLTVRESARIQTFNDDYKFCGSMNAQYSQIGNAVPVLIGKLLGDELIKSLSKIN
jgi:DNA (cytosine-5)-methyltransferase 1